MGLETLLQRPCTITHVAQTGPVDEYGNPTPVETTTSTVCYAHLIAAAENTVSTDVQREDWRVILPAGTAVTGDDRVTIPDADLVLEVQGPPWPAQNPRTQQISHVECTAREVT